MGEQTDPVNVEKVPCYRHRNMESEEIFFPEGMEQIEPHRFRMSGARRIIFPTSMKQIGFGSFVDCCNLEEVVFPEGLKSIGQYAFSGCEKLKRVIIPETAEIGEGAFYEYRRNIGCCPWCGSELNSEGNCLFRNHIHTWTGSLRLHRGYFWLDGDKLITAKICCNHMGETAYPVIFFGKREELGTHEEEWKRIRENENPAETEYDRHSEPPWGRVAIENRLVRVYLPSELDQQEIHRMIEHEFGLTWELHYIQEIRYITDN